MNKKTALLLLPSALILFVLGFIITFATNTTMHALHSILVIFFIIMGACQLFSFFWNKEYENKMYLNLIIGLTSMWFALFTFKNFDLFITLLPSIISIYSVMMGASLLIKHYERQDDNIWYFTGAIASFAFAVLLLLKPLLMATIYIKLAGLYLIALSVYFLVISVLRLTERQ